ncbi:cobamide remodeling phosphodiesterase CbiR [Maridesulfovibrio frigidus]|uniref:cobamide remodeling phosphodiesterase CbiR n=1 Tax=Maridesulfovibrio frigidus TaxID=340956 RepID=UPI000B24BBCA|nr:cobamide remodeling phosphodiesterase CbiR [Maridesulfovibrio frigidus]
MPEKTSMFIDGQSASSILGDKYFPYVIAAPSWVIPGTVSENCEYLQGRVDEVGLLFFETAGSLAYTEDDLPGNLADLGLSFHIHHPLDLPWADGAVKVAEIILSLSEKVAHLEPAAHVLHPPEGGPDGAKLLLDLAEELHGSSIAPEKVFIENIEENSLENLVETIRKCGFKICLDLGHMLVYKQQSLLESEGLWDMVAMLHLNGPGKGGKHESLLSLDSQGLDMLKLFFEKFHIGGTVVVEVFEQDGFFKSLQYLAEYGVKAD